jgi:hypothetical protein
VINNTYVNNSFAKNVNANRTSFNGGNGGIKTQPNAEQRKAMTNANKVGPTSEQLNRQQAAAKDKNLLASTNKGKPNQEAIKSFNKTEGAGQGKGAQGLGAAGGAGAGQGENKAGNMAEHNRQGEGAGQGQGGKGVGAGAGQGENKPGKMAEHHGQGTGMNGEEHANKLKTGNQGNMGNMGGNQAKMHTGNMGGNQAKMHTGNMGGNQAKMHTGNMGGAGGPAGQSHMKNQMSRNPQMGARNAQMGGKHPQMQGGGGGNRPKQGGQPQQGKKKPNQH